ncbi:MAG: NAD(P)-dependent oxidoreductase [Mogibacterium sp.]|nr:NAD(P)-dependent oxidoreductase [Mogibacterium sp.]
MKIAITGASGFIGTELLSLLKKTDNSIVGLTRGGRASEEETAGSGKIPDAEASCPAVQWKATDYTEASLAEVLEGVDVLVHLAGVRGTTPDPADYVINEEMTENILRAMVTAGVKRIVFASTISVYDDESLIPWTEDTPLKGRTAYGDSKIRCEQLIRRYADECGVTYGIARIAQVLGLGEKRRAMMNVFIDTAAAGGQLRVIGRSVVKRQYLYVKDLAKILAALACGNEHLSAGENITVNAGMPHAYTNLEIAQIVNRVFENGTPIDYDDSKEETIRPSWMSTELLNQALGIYPEDMEEAMTEVRSLKCE